jgi:hypothetical protein
VAPPETEIDDREGAAELVLTEQSADLHTRLVVARMLRDQAQLRGYFGPLGWWTIIHAATPVHYYWRRLRHAAGRGPHPESTRVALVHASGEAVGALSFAEDGQIANFLVSDKCGPRSTIAIALYDWAERLMLNEPRRYFCMTATRNVRARRFGEFRGFVQNHERSYIVTVPLSFLTFSFPSRSGRAPRWCQIDEFLGYERDTTKEV